MEQINHLYPFFWQHSEEEEVLVEYASRSQS